MLREDTRTEGVCQAGRYHGGGREVERTLQFKGIIRAEVLFQDVLSVFSEEVSMAVDEQERRVVWHVAIKLGGVERGIPYRDL